MANRSTYDEALGERILDLVADGATLSAARNLPSALS